MKSNGFICENVEIKCHSHKHSHFEWPSIESRWISAYYAGQLTVLYRSVFMRFKTAPRFHQGHSAAGL